ncbi:MAG: C-GCAxxG-C-C family protein [Proteobacteria bacterium]|nr:C-GCAxxG-C-C family protein [Pseudomonadota bacterium]
MEGQSEEQVIGERAKGYFGNGFHCAEAVVAAVLEEMGKDASEAIAHATAFGGGFGKTCGEACGALSGALIVIGHLHGRRESGKDWNLAAGMGAGIRQLFIHRFETTHCLSLREKFGQEGQMDQCRDLVGWVTRDLVSLLEKYPEKV